MKPGDLIRVVSHLKNPSIKEVLMFENWGRDGKAPKVIGKLKIEDVGVVLEDSSERGGNGVKILTSCGTVGWVYRSEVDVVE